MIDQSHNLKDPLEDLIQSTEAVLLAYAQALLVDREALAAAQELGDSHTAAYALSSLGLLCLDAEDYEAAAPYFERAIQIARERGLRRNLANTLTRAARVAVAVGDFIRARQLLDEVSGITSVSAEADSWYRHLRATLAAQDREKPMAGPPEEPGAGAVRAGA
jgi:tetratricopeptide (TPR) repeat protein